MALGGCPPRAPTDPYVHTLEHTVPQVMDSLLDVTVDDPRRRERIALQEPVESVPVHLAPTIAAIKPLPPGALNRTVGTPPTFAVAGDPVVRVVSAHLLTQYCMLFADREVPVIPAPLSNAPHGSAKSLRGRLPHHRPPAPPRSAPVMGKSQKVERAGLVVRSRFHRPPCGAGGERESTEFCRGEASGHICQSVGQHLHHSPRVVLVPEQDHEVVRIADQVARPRRRGCTSCRNHTSST